MMRFSGDVSTGEFLFIAIVGMALLIFSLNIQTALSESDSDKKAGQNDGDGKATQPTTETKKNTGFRLRRSDRKIWNASAWLMAIIIFVIFWGGLNLVAKDHPVAGYAVIVVSLVFIPVLIIAAFPNDDEKDKRTPVQRAIIADKVLEEVESKFFPEKKGLYDARTPDPDPEFDRRRAAQRAEEAKAEARREAIVARVLREAKKRIFPESNGR